MIDLCGIIIKSECDILIYFPHCMWACRVCLNSRTFIYLQHADLAGQDKRN